MVLRRAVWGTIETSIRKYGDLQVQTKRNKTRPPPPPPPPPP
eukprot:COSAG06_NODE_69984_length_194_cov_93.231579_1_plen_41_part_10